MNSINQSKIDLLYNAIYIQNIRYLHFTAIKTSGQWSSKFNDEIVIFKNLIKEYKQLFLNQINDLTKIITDAKEYNTTSYLTYNCDYYIEQFNNHIDLLNKYTDKVENLNIDNVLITDLSSLGKELDLLYPKFITVPSLFNELVKIPVEESKEEETKEEENKEEESKEEENKEDVNKEKTN